ncbi:MAG: solute-binding protein [Deltaproteobacteria bacterium]|nr:solute-binding protein [Deltaproteobacteria bacterium]
MAKPVRIMMASTSSVQNSGLLDRLIPAYEKATPYPVRVEVLAVGTGKAIRLAKRGKADLLLIHDPFREEKFVREGYGVNRREVMHNGFVLLGPARDPAGVREAKSIRGAFEKIARSRSPFVSRGDDSGTNMKEMDLWEDCGIQPGGKGWYLETGGGMAETLAAAGRARAYTLCDEGTYLNHNSGSDLEILHRGDPCLVNVYSLVVVNPARFPAVRYREAMDFIAFCTSPEGRHLIGAYVKHGSRLFEPEGMDALPPFRESPLS